MKYTHILGRMSFINSAVTVILLSLFINAPVEASEAECGRAGSGNMYGPYDYVTQPEKVPIVNQGHFTPQVESLARGQSMDYVGGDLAYVLQAIPNHHRGLIAAERLSVKSRADPPPFMTLTIYCWYDRAIRFSPKDVVVKMLFASHLVRSGKSAEARKLLEITQKMAGENALTQHNVGMVYFEMKAFDEAVAQAQLAESLGLQNSKLMQLLKSTNKWPVKPEAASANTAAASDIK